MCHKLQQELGWLRVGSTYQPMGFAKGLKSGWCHGFPASFEAMRACASPTEVTGFVRSPGPTTGAAGWAALLSAISIFFDAAD